MRLEDISVIKEKGLFDRPSFDELFMSFAIGVSRRASCKHVQAGSIIVDPETNELLGEGYNGVSPGRTNCLEAGCRKELAGLSYGDKKNSGYCEGIHAEMNALGHLTKSNSSKGIKVYNTIFPCHTCAKNLLPYNLKELIFKNVYSDEELERTMSLLNDARVKVSRLDLSVERFATIGLYQRNEIKFGAWTPEQKEFADRINIFLMNHKQMNDK